MTNRELIIEFERILQTKDKSFILVNKLDTDTILQFLNTAQTTYVNMNMSLFEKNEQNSRNLVRLLVNTTIDLTEEVVTNKVNPYIKYTAIYPENLMYMLDEAVMLNPTGKPEEQQPAEIFECTLDSYMYRITNTLTDFHWHHNYARPLRVRTKDGCLLFTDTNYEINKYSINYFRQLNPITLAAPNDEYSEFDSNIHKEIVQLAVNLFIDAASNGSKKDKKEKE